MEITAHRDRLYDWLRRCLVGNGDALIGIKPLDRYQTGTLFPVVRGEFGLDPAGQEADGGDDAVDDEEDVDDSEQAAQGTSPRKRRFVPPSSVGLSFFVAGDQVRFQLIPRGVRYVRKEDRRDEGGRFAPESWRPEGVGVDFEGLDFTAPARRKMRTDRELVFGERAELLVLWRPLETGWLVTASLSNMQLLEPSGYGGEDAIERNEKSLFQVEFECAGE